MTAWLSAFFRRLLLTLRKGLLILSLCSIPNSSSLAAHCSRGPPASFRSAETGDPGAFSGEVVERRATEGFTSGKRSRRPRRCQDDRRANVEGSVPAHDKPLKIGQRNRRKHIRRGVSLIRLNSMRRLGGRDGKRIGGGIDPDLDGRSIWIAGDYSSCPHGSRSMAVGGNR